MAHICAIVWQKELNESFGATNFFRNFKKKLRRNTLLYGENPLRLQLFKSDKSVKEEQERQLSISAYLIHPYSKFRAWYEVYLIYLYASLLVVKPLEAGFLYSRIYKEYPYLREYNLFLDALSVIDIIMHFFTGYVHKSTVELRHSYIAKKYIFSPYFVCDLVSSVPRGVFYYDATLLMFKRFYGVMSILAQFKLIRLVTLTSCIKRSAEYFRIMSRGVLFLFCSLVITLIIVHFMTSLQFTIPRITRWYFIAGQRGRDNSSWYNTPELLKAPLSVQYSFCLFRSSACILGMELDMLKRQLAEDYVLTVATYIIGKVLIAFIWIILAVSILSSRSVDITFLEILNQLDEYLKQKQLPLNIKEKISQYYDFKYGDKYFRENAVTSSLSSTLKNDVNMHICKGLIASISLFSDLTPQEVNTVVQYLIPEIFLPNDVIIKCGDVGDAMYFLSSGTVAVYTRSGKEICHLAEGAYFGEICLIMKGQTRTATVVAIETTDVFRLKRKHFEKCFINNKKILRKTLRLAQRRLKESLDVEKEYMDSLFRRSSLIRATKSGNELHHTGI